MRINFSFCFLAIALNHYGVPFDSVEIIPGDVIRFNLPNVDEHGRNSISIPINAKGQMQVNWAGIGKIKKQENLI